MILFLSVQFPSTWITAYKKKENLGQVFLYQGDRQNLTSYV